MKTAEKRLAIARGIAVHHCDEIRYRHEGDTINADKCRAAENAMRSTAALLLGPEAFARVASYADDYERQVMTARGYTATVHGWEKP